MGGSPRTVVKPGQVLPDLDWPGELASLTDTWPGLGPSWLAATEKALPDLRPWHTVATRARGELALAPGYILDAPPPGLELAGWPDGPEGAGPRFPALLLGSPLGHRTEVVYNFWTPALMATMAAALVPAAFAAGVRCVLAPWIPDRRGNQALADALVAAGGHAAAAGGEDFVRLDAGGWDAHLAALAPGIRDRIDEDARRTAAAGVGIERADGDAIRPHLPRLAGLACGGGGSTGPDPAQVAGLLAALLDSGVDVRAYLGVRDGAVVASCLAIRKNHRLFVSWPGSDDALGAHSGARAAVTLDAPVRDACGEGLRTVEFGSGEHRAAAQRGVQSQPLTSVTILADAAG